MGRVKMGRVEQLNFRRKAKDFTYVFPPVRFPSQMQDARFVIFLQSISKIVDTGGFCSRLISNVFKANFRELFL